VLRRFFELVGNDPDGFVKGIEDAFLRERAKDLTPSELRDAAREISYNLLGVIATGFILRTGSWVGSRRIEEDVENVIQRHDSTARRLIQVASRLVLPGDLPHEQIKKLAKDLRHNPFAFAILQSVGLRYLHLFFVAPQDKQRLCSALNIDFKSAQFIDFANKESKFLSKR